MSVSRIALVLTLPLTVGLVGLLPGCTVNTTTAPPPPPPQSQAGMGEHNAPVGGAGLLIRSALNQQFCADAAGDKAVGGTPVTLYTCTAGKENQRWTFSDQPGGEITITGIGGLCLDIRGHKSGAGAPLQLWPCDNMKNQKFRHESDGRLREAETGKCLTTASVANGSPLALAECDRSNGGQVWVVAR